MDVRECIFFAAINNNDYETVECILKKKSVDVNSRNSNFVYETPLKNALFKENYEITKLLLENGADPNEDSPLKNVVQISDDFKRRNFFKLLVKYGSKLSEKSIISAVENGRVEILKTYKKMNRVGKREGKGWGEFGERIGEYLSDREVHSGEVLVVKCKKEEMYAIKSLIVRQKSLKELIVPSKSKESTSTSPKTNFKVELKKEKNCVVLEGLDPYSVQKCIDYLHGKTPPFDHHFDNLTLFQVYQTAKSLSLDSFMYYICKFVIHNVKTNDVLLLLMEIEDSKQLENEDKQRSNKTGQSFKCAFESACYKKIKKSMNGFSKEVKQRIIKYKQLNINLLDLNLDDFPPKWFLHKDFEGKSKNKYKKSNIENLDAHISQMYDDIHCPHKNLVLISSDGYRTSVHKEILFCRSSYFYQMFKNRGGNHFQESFKSEIKIADLDIIHLTLLLQFFYTKGLNQRGSRLVLKEKRIQIYLELLKWSYIHFEKELIALCKDKISKIITQKTDLEETMKDIFSYGFFVNKSEKPIDEDYLSFEKELFSSWKSKVDDNFFASLMNNAFLLQSKNSEITTKNDILLKKILGLEVKDSELVAKNKALEKKIGEGEERYNTLKKSMTDFHLSRKYNTCEICFKKTLRRCKNCKKVYYSEEGLERK